VSFFISHFLALGVPTADLDNNGKIDLQDAISAVRGLQSLSETADALMGKTSSFRQSLRNAVKVFRTIAGEEMQVKKADDTSANHGVSFLVLQPSSMPGYSQPVQFIKYFKELDYQSIDSDQVTPPPKRLA
jgi:hypothetical protein